MAAVCDFLFPRAGLTPVFPLFSGLINTVGFIWACVALGDHERTCSSFTMAWSVIGLMTSLGNLICAGYIYHKFMARGSTPKLMFHKGAGKVVYAVLCFWVIIWMMVGGLSSGEDEDRCKKQMSVQVTILIFYVLFGIILLIFTYFKWRKAYKFHDYFERAKEEARREQYAEEERKVEDERNRQERDATVPLRENTLKVHEEEQGGTMKREHKIAEIVVDHYLRSDTPTGNAVVSMGSVSQSPVSVSPPPPLPVPRQPQFGENRVHPHNADTPEHNGLTGADIRVATEAEMRPPLPPTSPSSNGRDPRSPPPNQETRQIRRLSQPADQEQVVIHIDDDDLITDSSSSDVEFMDEQHPSSVKPANMGSTPSTSSAGALSPFTGNLNVPPALGGGTPGGVSAASPTVISDETFSLPSAGTPRAVAPPLSVQPRVRDPTARRAKNPNQSSESGHKTPEKQIKRNR